MKNVARKKIAASPPMTATTTPMIVPVWFELAPAFVASAIALAEAEAEAELKCWVADTR